MKIPNQKVTKWPVLIFIFFLLFCMSYFGTVFIENTTILHWAVHNPIAFHNFKSQNTCNQLLKNYAFVVCYHPYLVSLLFAVLLSLHLNTCCMCVIKIGATSNGVLSLKSCPCSFCLHAGPLNSDGQLSNFVHFQNCTFTGNIAEQFGAAMGFTSFLVFQNVENVRSFEIESWWAVYVKLHLQFL